MSKDEMWDKLYELVQTNEDEYYDVAHKALEKNNAIGNAIHCVGATAFQRVRYMMETLMENSITEDKTEI